MRVLVAVAVGVMLSPLNPAVAQGVTPGSNYSGTMNRGGANRTDQVEIKISKVDGGAVYGSAARFVPGFCRGEVPVEGVLEGDKLTLRSVKGAPEVKKDCDFEWELRVDGKTLEGKSTGGATLRFSRQ